MLGMGTRPATPLPEPHHSLCCFHENPEKPRVRAGHRALAEGSRRLHPPSARGTSRMRMLGPLCFGHSLEKPEHKALTCCPVPSHRTLHLQPCKNLLKNQRCVTPPTSLFFDNSATFW